jgi:hypothetical protein
MIARNEREAKKMQKPDKARRDRATDAWTRQERIDAKAAMVLLPDRLRQGFTDIIDGYHNTDDAVNAWAIIRWYWEKP